MLVKHALAIPFILIILSGCSTLSSSLFAKTKKAPPQMQQTEAEELAPEAEELISEVVVESQNKQVSITKNVSDTVEPTNTNLWHKLRAGFRMPELGEHSKVIKKHEKWFAQHPQYFQRLTKRAYWFLPSILKQVEQRNMPTEIALLPAIESAYRLSARSHANAVGMWQFISSTGRYFGLRQDQWYDGRRDLLQSTRAALDYLDFLSKEFKGDWSLALAAYNAGENGVKKAQRYNAKHHRRQDYASLTRLKRETREYVPKLIAMRNIIRTPKKYGITLKPIPNQPTLVQIDVLSQTDLTVVARVSGLSVKRLRYFNQGYKYDVTPPNGPHKLMIPTKHAAQTEFALNGLSHKDRLRWARHIVRKGEHLGIIAQKYGVTINSVKKTNGIKGHIIKPGQVFRIPLSTGSNQIATDFYQSKPAIYRVRHGDSLWGIAKKHGLRISSITRWNNISKSSRIYPGQKLSLYRNNKTSSTLLASTGKKNSYKIKRGDSLWSISRRYGMSIAKIASINGITKHTLLRPGQYLTILPN